MKTFEESVRTAVRYLQLQGNVTRAATALSAAMTMLEPAVKKEDPKEHKCLRKLNGLLVDYMLWHSAAFGTPSGAEVLEEKLKQLREEGSI